MNKNVLFLLLIILFSACGGTRKTYKIGVSQCAGGTWREKVNHEMLAAQHLYDQDVKVNIENANDDVQLQIRQIDSLSKTGIDLLVVAPSESEPIADAVERVRQKGIPVVYFDRKAASDNYTAFIGGDNVMAGTMIGTYVANHINELCGGENKPVVMELSGFMKTSAAVERHKGFSEVMKRHPELNYRFVECDWTDRMTDSIVRSQIAMTERPDIIFCHNDAMGNVAYRVVKEAHLENDIRIFGIDGMPGKDHGIEFVQKGVLAATYIYPTHGEKIVQLAYDILTGRSYQRNNVLAGALVTPEDVDRIAQSSTELVEQTQHLLTIHDKLENYYGLYNSQQKIIVATAIILCLLLLAIALFWRATRQMKRANNQKKQLLKEQTRFYTNASHQLKTPLTLIAGPVKKLMDSGTLKEEEKELMEIVNRNVAQLETVTEDVLNFGKEAYGTINDETAENQVPSSILTDSIADQNLQENRLNVLKQDDSDDLSTVLIVDDNDDMRRYLRTLLADRFYVLEAPDGQSGLKLARESVPDIVVSDVMMPVMDGLQLCRCLKEDAITSHVPVILLTARSEKNQQIEGLEHGADAYLTKPFYADLLVARIYNLLNSRKQLRQLFDAKPQEEQVQFSTQDKLFADSLKETIRRNMSKSTLKMDEIGDEMGLSRVQLYRKVKALTGISPVELLRQMRLQQGYNLICSSQKTITEIAYEVGFGTPAYFSKCFKQQFGKYPSDLRAE